MSVSNQPSCPICFESFIEGVPTLSHQPEGSGVTAAAAEALGASATSIPAEHKFHQDCITEWLKTNFNCPVCRAAGDVFGVQRVTKKNLFLAIIEGNLEIVQALLVNGPISEGVRGLAIMQAADQGHREIVQALLANGPISEDMRHSAIHNAAFSGNLEIVKALLENGPISDYTRGQAVLVAAHMGHLEIVRELLASGSISLSNRSDAIKEALLSGNYRIVSELLPAKAILATAFLGLTASYITFLQYQDEQ